jgi:L-ribulose-5-phosphate 3-epimerase
MMLGGATTMLKKGLCLGCLRRDLEPREAFERARAAGFDGIELGLNAQGRVGLPAPYDEPDRAAELARSVGLELPSVSGPGFIDLFTREVEEVLPEIVARTERGCQAARALGADAMLQIPGFVQIAWDSRSPVIPYEVAWERTLAIYRALAPVAERAGVCLCMENVWNRFLLSPLEMRQFVDAIDSPWVRVYFDVGNVLVTGFPEQWLQILGPRVGRIHLKDFRTAVGNLNGFVMLLEGDVNWTAVMAAVREIGYDGYLIAEYGPYRHGPDTLLAHLSASMDRIISLAEETS